MRTPGRSRLLLVLVPLAAFLAGCVSAPITEEEAAREKVQALSARLSLGAEASKALPVPGPDATLTDFVRFAVQKHPGVAAAYYDWLAAVEAITPARSLPDPRLTFEADIMDELMSFMPGFMFDVMTRGKRAAMGREAAARSGVAYETFRARVQRVAADVRRAWVELAYVEQAIRLHDELLAAYDEAATIAAGEYATTAGMASLEAQVRLQNLAAEHHAEHLILFDRREAARVRFKSSLGLSRAENDPSWPAAMPPSVPLASLEELWSRAAAASPEVAQMRAMADMALAEVDAARRTRTPDFELGLMVDLKASPLMFRPTAGVTLPIWRDKISATIAAAQARHDAAAARLDAEKISLTAELAQMLFMVREADRMIAYIQDAAIPNLQRVVSTVAAGYQSGMGSAVMMSETRAMIHQMDLERIGALREREMAVTDLLLMLAEAAPPEVGLVAAADTAH